MPCIYTTKLTNKYMKHGKNLNKMQLTGKNVLKKLLLALPATSIIVSVLFLVLFTY